MALRPDATAQDYRLARKALIEAIAALSDSAARMGGEPARRAARARGTGGDADRRPWRRRAALGGAHRAARGARREADLARAEAKAARNWLVARLSAKTAAEAESGDGVETPSTPLMNATLALLAAAREYRRASAPA